MVQEACEGELGVDILGLNRLLGRAMGYVQESGKLFHYDAVEMEDRGNVA
jgi:hypothetical protein